MCGIIGYNGFEDPKTILLDGLRRLEYRGYDSAGIAVMEENTSVKVYRAAGKIRNLEEKVAKKHFHGSLGLGHTRWATHGAPNEINAHPHKVGTVTLVHNGIIENYLELRKGVMASGRKLSSETDSEIVAHLFDIEVQKHHTLAEAMNSVLPKLRGSYAFVILSEKEPDTIVGVRNGAPLLVGIGKKETFIASDVQAVLHRTKDIIYLKDHQYVVCKKDKVEVHDTKGKKVRVEIHKINWNAEQIEKGGFAHFMLKEIHEQPQALANTLEGNVDPVSGLISLNELQPLKFPLEKVERIYLVACGTARHAALVGKYLIERFARIPVEVDFGSEFRYRDPVLDKHTLVVAISQSGETADTLAGLRAAKSKKVPALSICNVRESTIARECSAVLYTNAGPEIGVASTKAFTTQLAVLGMLAIELGIKKQVLEKSKAKHLTNDLVRLPHLVERTLELEAKIERLAQKYLKCPFYFFMGRDINYPIALEAALKLKEISYVPAEGYPAGELKHGPIALIDSHTVTVVLAAQNTTSTNCLDESQLNSTLYEKVMSNLQEIRARGGKTIVIGTENDEILPGQCDHFLGVPAATWATNPILMTIPVQLLAYHVAALKGTDVDKPRNLAKSVTVE